LPGAGHMGMFEAPDKTTRFIEGFLNFCE